MEMEEKEGRGEEDVEGVVQHLLRILELTQRPRLKCGVGGGWR